MLKYIRAIWRSRVGSVCVILLGIGILVWVLSGTWLIEVPGPTFNVMSHVEPKGNISSESGELLLMTVSVSESSTLGAVVCQLQSQCTTVSANQEQVVALASDQRKTSEQVAVDIAKGVTKLENNQKFSLNLPEVAGPSGGLISTIAFMATGTKTIPVPKGKAVAVTGTVNPSGLVGPVGGVDLKVEAAIRDGAWAFLVPVEEQSLATEVAEGRITIVGVSTVTQAWQWLCTNGAQGTMCSVSR